MTPIAFYKVLNVNAYANEDTLRRFCWEAFYGQNLHHEHIISTLNAYHIAEEGKAPLPVIELEYIDGVSLERFIYLHEIQGRYLIPEQVLGFAIQIADAIEHLHNAMGLAHRDIKPKNIMLIETDGVSYPPCLLPLLSRTHLKNNFSTKS